VGGDVREVVAEKWAAASKQCKKHVDLYVNAKMIPVETITGKRGRIKEEEWKGINSSTIYLIYDKNFYKYHSVPSLSTTKKNMVVGGTEGYESNRRVNLNEDYNICMHGTMTKGSLCRINL
jgi:hypothetical protein